MTVWITAVAAGLLWAVALFFAIRQFRRIGRNIRRGHLQMHIRSSYANAEELNKQFEAGSTDPVVVIRWAMLAGDAQDLARRAELVMQRFPDLLEGPLLLVHAWRSMGDDQRAEALARKWYYYFPYDIELITLLIEFAQARKDWPAVLPLSKAMSGAAPTSCHPLLLKINALIEIGNLKRIEKALVAAEAEFPENPEVAKLWDRYEAMLAGPESAQSGS